jgi:hypothetical protein
MPPPNALTSITAAVVDTVEIPLATRDPTWLIRMLEMLTVLGADDDAGGVPVKACVSAIVEVRLKAMGSPFSTASHKS